MMTLAEAHQRLQVNSMHMTGPYRNWTVRFNEPSMHRRTYNTDCLEDAVIQAGRMRLERRAEMSGSR